jgi:D-3-phosphoglycerate dehydrogenase
MEGRVLICDPIAKEGVDLLQEAGLVVEERLGLSPQELAQVVPPYVALIVRSQTRVTREAIEAGTNLQVIGRAGTGVDNIDVEAATERGIIVVNAPTGNIVSAAEHTIALMLALARKIPQADASLRQGRWERGRFMGVEMRGKTLGIIGLGQVGSEVARRARGLEMRVIAHDPYISAERARILGVELVSLEELLHRADFITIHTPLTDSTKGLIGEEELRMMKPTARLINTARGGIVDEEALVRALKEGWIAGAALDVFSQEPLTQHPLFGLDNVVLTPHLGASTAEAQERVAVDVAEQVLAVLRGQPARYAVNAPLIPPETFSFLAPYLGVAKRAASLAVQLCEAPMGEVEVYYYGDLGAHDTTPLRAAVVQGLLSTITEEHVNIVNVDLVIRRRGLRLTEHHGPPHETYSNLITVSVGESQGRVSVSATLAHDGPHIVSINDFWVDVPPGEGYLLICENLDRPGMIGAVGTLLGNFDVNISFMNVGRHQKRGRALMVLALDEPLTPEQLRAVRRIPDIYSARLARL